MRMKRVILTLVAVAFLATTIFSTAFAAEPAESFTIDKAAQKKTPVVFPHKKHSDDYGVKCKECHHMMKSDTDTPKACFECHKLDDKNDMGDLGVAPPVRAKKKKDIIFHTRCVQCHKDKDKGPKKCKECHPK